MEPVHANLADATPRNAPRDMLARLYREIGVSAVAAALGVSIEMSDACPVNNETHITPVKHAA